MKKKCNQPVTPPPFPLARRCSGITKDSALTPPRNRFSVGYLPPLSASPPSPSPAGVAAVAPARAAVGGGGRGGEGLAGSACLLTRNTGMGLATTTGFPGSKEDRDNTRDMDSGSATREITAGSGQSGLSMVSTGSAAANAAGPKAPASLLKQKSSINRPPNVGGGGGRGGGLVRNSSRYRDDGVVQEMPTRLFHRRSTSGSERGTTTTKVSMRESGEGFAIKRPQRYEKIKMKSPVAKNNNCNNNKENGSSYPNANGRHAEVPNRRPAIKLIMEGGAFGALSVAHKVVSGFRGDPDWASGVSRSAHKR